jgi:hypothetical protein
VVVRDKIPLKSQVMAAKSEESVAGADLQNKNRKVAA